MPRVRIDIPVPGWLHGNLRRVKRLLSSENGRPLDLSGDREIEWTFIATQMPHGPGEALDFGCGHGNLSLLAAAHGFKVLALDLQPYVFSWNHSDVRFVQGDLLKLDLPKGRFDLIINCSSVEHVGLAGRFGATESASDGDLQAMRRLRDLMKPGARMLLTIPCGRDAVFAPLHRVYGGKRLPLLLDGYFVEHQVFWVKEPDNRWVSCELERALSFHASADFNKPARCSYALGCFVLSKSVGST